MPCSSPSFCGPRILASTIYFSIMRENISRIRTLMKVPEASCSPSSALFSVHLRILGLLHVIDYTWLNIIVYIWK
jgi:hypothetical protein